MVENFLKNAPLDKPVDKESQDSTDSFLSKYFKSNAFNELSDEVKFAFYNINYILKRMKSLSTQATSDSLTADAREDLNLEFRNLKLEIVDIYNSLSSNYIDESFFSPSKIFAEIKDPIKIDENMSLTLSSDGTTTIYLNGVAVTNITSFDADN